MMYSLVLGASAGLLEVLVFPDPHPMLVFTHSHLSDHDVREHRDV